ncbi:hypothetical protein [Massilia yuzhufengensis]|uniref:Uracil DNA glycosylase superfamily protein n=1 Tax=Massilia yuzhufengensis TaxID=1164594 RepID=A0A1I1TSE2_9BURK|nr:hypothetical protein [Massilia yuzhufengensis]SFD58440.1 hypothetical protein SAMN05216204_12923 [Massilia yuzhufengensis]
MPELLFSRYRDAIRSLDLASVTSPADIPDTFMLGREGRYSTYYIPFESVHPQARIVVAGITPGFAQWKNAMREAQLQLAAGADDGAVLRAARLAGAFSGAIRPNFVALLDAIGVQRWLGIASCATLFGAHAGLVQVSAILRHPVFVDGKNYSGSPPAMRSAFLRAQVLRWFAEEARLLPDALYIPMGGSVGDVLDWLAEEGVIKAGQILHGLPHPSGANAERVAYFLGRKDRAALSGKTNGAHIDAAREALLAHMDGLAGWPPAPGARSRG